MMKANVYIILLILLVSCSRRAAPDVTAELMERGGGMVDVRITNGLASEAVLISPQSPNLLIDAERCTVVLSTKVAEWNRPYDFTPQLVAIKAGETRIFTVNASHAVPSKCGRWRFDLEYTYLAAREAREAARQDSVRFRGYVLRNQHLTARSSPASPPPAPRPPSPAPAPGRR
jgi:hypothetical protein